MCLQTIHTEAPQVAAYDGTFEVRTHIFVIGDQRTLAGNRYQRASAEKRGEGLKPTKSLGTSQEHHGGHDEKTQEVPSPKKPGNFLGKISDESSSKSFRRDLSRTYLITLP